MGLFSSWKSDQPQAPLPSLELHLVQSRDAVVKPGDTVAGHVTLSTPGAITPQAVEVAFWGRSETWIRRSSSHKKHTTYYHYRDHAPIFTVTYNVLSKADGNVLLPGQTYTMPFSFTTPMGTGINRADCYEHPGDAVWTVSPHDLPPTFFHSSHGAEDRPHNCSISYGITARLICAGLAVATDNVDPIACTAPIIFAPLNSYAHITNPNRHRHSKKFALSSSTLAGEASTNTSFRQSLMDRFSSHTPKVDFELAVELPDLMRSGSEFSFKTSFTTLNKTDNVARLPELTFRVLRLELLDFTFFRAPRDWKANNMMSGAPSRWKDGTPTSSFRASDQTEFAEGKTLLNSLPNFCTVELPEVPVEKSDKTEQGKDCEIWFTARVPGFTTPSFRSFAITRTYRIKVKMGIEIGGKKFDYTVEGGEVHMGSA